MSKNEKMLLRELKNARAFDGALLISDEGRKEIVRMLERLDALEQGKDGRKR